MQYKLFSTNTHFLPLVPQGLSITIGRNTEISNVEVPKNYGLLNGEATVFNHFSMNTDSSNLLNNKKLKDKIDNFSKVQEKLKQLSLKSITQQDKRMENEAENGRDFSNNSNSNGFSEMSKKVQIKLQNELLNERSNEKEGFILWSKETESLPPLQDVCPDSFDPHDVLEHVANLKAAEKEAEKTAANNKDGDANGDQQVRNDSNGKVQVGNTKRKKNAKDRRVVLYNSAKKIVGAAKSVLADVATGKIKVEDPIGPLTIEWFKEMHITTQEYNFYRARETVEDVIKLASLEYEKVSLTKWEILPLPQLLVVDQERIVERRKKHQLEIERASKICSTLLVKMGHGSKKSDEIIERGCGLTAMSGVKSK
jgi:hypothetical protein